MPFTTQMLDVETPRTRMVEGTTGGALKTTVAIHTHHNNRTLERTDPDKRTALATVWRAHTTIWDILTTISKAVFGTTRTRKNCGKSHSNDLLVLMTSWTWGEARVHTVRSLFLSTGTQKKTIAISREPGTFFDCNISFLFLILIFVEGTC